MSGDLLVAALALKRAGLPVFPLLPRTKRPRCKGGFKGATLDHARIVHHWRAYPDDNIGVPPPGGMVVVDVDLRAGGDAELARLVAEHGPLPETWTARTGSGGWHYWFTIGDVDRIPGKLCAGIDLKHGDTGFVVAPPSIHPNGRAYEWLAPPYGQPTIAPAWLCEAMQPPSVVPNGTTGTGTLDASTPVRGHGPYTVQCLVARILAAREGSRNRTLFGALKDAARQGDLGAFGPELAAAAYTAGLDAQEVEKCFRSVRGGA